MRGRPHGQRQEEAHPASSLGRCSCRTSINQMGERDANEDYPEPAAPAAGFRVWQGEDDRRVGQPPDRGGSGATRQRTGALLWLPRATTGYDRLAARRFEFVPLWGMPVFFCYAMRRVDCPRCGVKVEAVPWAEGKNHLTIVYAWFLAAWAKRMSWKEVAEAFRTSWENVFRSVEMAVTWGRAHQDLSGVAAIGVDEIHWSCRQGFLTLVYQIDEGCRRLLWVGQHRRVKTLMRFFRWFGQARTAQLSNRRNRALPHAWRPTGAAIHPQILLRRSKVEPGAS